MSAAAQNAALAASASFTAGTSDATVVVPLTLKLSLIMLSSKLGSLTRLPFTCNLMREPVTNAAMPTLPLIVESPPVMALAPVR